MNDEPVKIIHYCWFGPRKLSKVLLDKLMKIKSGLL